MNEKDQLFQLFIVCLGNRKRPNAVNGDVRAENRAWDDAVYALHYFERQYYEHYEREKKMVSRLRRKEGSKQDGATDAT